MVSIMNVNLILPQGACYIASQGKLHTCVQAYEGLETAKELREEYVFVPAKVGLHLPLCAQLHGVIIAAENLQPQHAALE